MFNKLFQHIDRSKEMKMFIMNITIIMMRQLMSPNHQTNRKLLLHSIRGAW